MSDARGHEPGNPDFGVGSSWGSDDRFKRFGSGVHLQSHYGWRADENSFPDDQFDAVQGRWPLGGYQNSDVCMRVVFFEDFALHEATAGRLHAFGSCDLPDDGDERAGR